MDKTSECYSKAEKTIMAVMDNCAAIRDENTRLTAERDALAERVRRYEAFVAAWDVHEGADPGIPWEMVPELDAARAAIAECGERA